VREPIGFASPLRTASTPATKVVATAPMPGIITPNFPLAGEMLPEEGDAEFCRLAIKSVRFFNEFKTGYLLVLRRDLQSRL
jgi:hypothetical protein